MLFRTRLVSHHVIPSPVGLRQVLPCFELFARMDCE